MTPFRELFRAFPRSLACLVFAMLAAAGVAQSNAATIHIGFLSVRTGALAAGSKQMEAGINLFLKERNNPLAGRKVELFVADTGGTPAKARAKAQELVEKDRVQVIIGPLATFEALAIDDYIAQVRVPLITPTSAAQTEIQGRIEDKPAFVRALHEARLEKSPIGPIYIDEYGKPVLNIYVRKVERKGRRLVNSIIATYPKVSQF